MTETFFLKLTEPRVAGSLVSLKKASINNPTCRVIFDAFKVLTGSREEKDAYEEGGENLKIEGYKLR